MRSKDFFLRWVLTATLIAVGAFIAGTLGWHEQLFGADPTHITYVTLGVFVLATAYCGRLSWRLAQGHDPELIEVDLRHGRFSSSLCVSIGLIGTAIGYYIMLVHGADSGDPAEIIKQAFANTSISVVNTVFGAVCGVLVEVQCHFIDHALERALLNVERTERAELLGKIESIERERHDEKQALLQRIEQLVRDRRAPAPAPASLPEPAPTGGST